MKDHPSTSSSPLLQLTDLEMTFPIRSGVIRRKTGEVHAVDGISVDVNRRQTLGLVGESGCGKSTLARTVVRLYEPTAGRIVFDGQDITNIKGSELRALRRDIQFIFQDPSGSLDPRFRVRELISEGLKAQGLPQSKNRLVEVLDLVGLRPEALDRYPHEFSGGQKQRIAIARALVLNPKLIVADEAVSALDVSFQSHILNLFVSLQKELGLTYIFVSHNIAAISYVSDSVGIMYLGKLVEVISSNRLLTHSMHPYTQALLSAVPEPDMGAKKERIVIGGEVPSPANPPSGCRFRTRCPLAQPICGEVEPLLTDVTDGHPVACHFPQRLDVTLSPTVLKHYAG